MDDLTRYVIDYYRQFMTKEESLAYGLSIQIRKAISYKSIDRTFEILCTSDVHALILLIDGVDAFYERVRDRILSDHKDGVFLNNCPKCGALTRTPTARQCKKCGNDWH